MAHIVIGAASAIVCHREVPSLEALEQARTASTEFPEATDAWLFGSLSEAPWHVSLVPAPRGKKRAA